MLMAKTHPKSPESTVESQKQEDTPDSGLSTPDSGLATDDAERSEEESS